MDVFEGVTEKVTFNDIAIAMGNETLHQQARGPMPAKTVKRRYTNIWMQTRDTWQLVAWQSTIISVE